MNNRKNQDSLATCDIKVDGASLKGYRLQDFQDKDAWGNAMPGLVATSRERENSAATS
jgi:hypothetical protein